jgi:hypothetical protein
VLSGADVAVDVDTAACGVFESGACACTTEKLTKVQRPSHDTVAFEIRVRQFIFITLYKEENRRDWADKRLGLP